MPSKENSPNQLSRNWAAIIFISITHFIGLFAWPIYLLYDGAPQWQEISAFFFMYFLTVLGVNFGYHRGICHRSFQMSRPLKFLSLFAASSTAENSALIWCSDHRRHHRYQDTERDPYNINQGFWWAHIGWIFGRSPKRDFSNCPDLLKDPLVMNQHRYYVIWLILSCFGLPLFIGFLIGRPLACLLLAGFTRLFVVNHITYLVNSWAHYFGRRPYDSKSTARDSLFVAILASGEGYHNFHHRFPFDFRNGHRWFEWDPTKWLIYLAYWTGQAWNLKRTPAVEIYRARIQTQELKVKVKNPEYEELSQVLKSALIRWRKLNFEWQQLRNSFDTESRERLKQLKTKMEEAKKDFKQRYQEWYNLSHNLQAQTA